MNTPSRNYLDWQRKVQSEPSTPPHLGFTPRECRGFIHSFIALDTIDFQSRCNNGSEDEMHLIALMEDGDFPIRTLSDIQRFTEEERNEVRSSINRVFLPTDSQGRLDVLLPIDVLTGVIQNVGKSRLFPGSISDESFPDASNQLSEWYIDKHFTDTIPAFVLCSGIEGWLCNAKTAPLYRSSIARYRDQAIQKFNRRIMPVTITNFIRPPCAEDKLKWS